MTRLDDMGQSLNRSHISPVVYCSYRLIIEYYSVSVPCFSCWKQEKYYPDGIWQSHYVFLYSVLVIVNFLDYILVVDELLSDHYRHRRNTFNNIFGVTVPFLGTGLLIYG